jgi:hypothetical protein
VIEIPLTRGYVAQIDDSDLELVGLHKWCAMVKRFPDGKIRNIYAYRSIRVSGKQTTQFLHRFLLPVGNGLDVDHHDHNGLNCQRYNLRPATKSQNQANSRKSPGGTSEFKGVSWNAKRRRWIVQITLNGKTALIGQFHNENDAAFAYNSAAIKAFGNFAHLNAAAKEKLD